MEVVAVFSMNSFPTERILTVELLKGRWAWRQEKKY